MFQTMTLLNETCDLNSISSHSLSFRDFQSFVEGEYFRRPGNDVLVGLGADNGAAQARSSEPKLTSN